MQLHWLHTDSLNQSPKTNSKRVTMIKCSKKRSYHELVPQHSYHDLVAWWHQFESGTSQEVVLELNWCIIISNSLLIGTILLVYMKGSNRPRGGWIGGSKNLKLKNSMRKLKHWPVPPAGLNRYYQWGITGTTDTDDRYYRYPTETKKSEICELWFQIWVLPHYRRWCWWSLWTLLSCPFTK
jgi:hypothetical protein